ncbi:MAG: hypothetical protein AB1497_08510 [Bacillota bacterium]
MEGLMTFVFLLIFIMNIYRRLAGEPPKKRSQWPHPPLGPVLPKAEPGRQVPRVQVETIEPKRPPEPAMSASESPARPLLVEQLESEHAAKMTEVRLTLSDEELIRGIVLSEVLGPPRARKPYAAGWR